MEYKIGDIVTVSGRPYVTSYGGNQGAELTNYSGTITHINSKDNVPYPIHVDQKGWFAVNSIENSTTASTIAVADTTTIEIDNYRTNYITNSNIARRTYVAITFQGKNITKLINKYLISFSYNDNQSDTADDITITLEDKDCEWLSWLSADDSLNIRGAKISAVIIKDNWNSNNKKEALDCGTFEVDTVDGSDSTITLKASAITESSKLGNEVHKQIWENMSLDGIALEIASRNGYSLVNIIPKYYYVRVEQNETDIAFLQRLSHEKGISLKVTNKMIVMFDQEMQENEDAVFEIKKGDGYLGYKWKVKADDCEYKMCEVKYTSPDTKETIEGSFALPSYNEEDEDNNKKLTISDEKVTSKAEAETLAKKRLREKNKEGEYMTFEFPGNTNFFSGLNVNVTGFYGLDGKYTIEKVAHKISSGYVTSITIRKVLEGY